MDGLKRGLSSLLFSKGSLDGSSVSVDVLDQTPSKRLHGGFTAAAAAATEEAVVEQLLRSTLADADAELRTSLTHSAALEEDWSDKMGEYIRINAQLRVESKQSTRKVTALEGELAKAKERIASLEQALTDIALDSSYSAASPRAFEPIAAAGSMPVASLGKGHGGVALSHVASPQGAAFALASATSSANFSMASALEAARSRTQDATSCAWKLRSASAGPWRRRPRWREKVLLSFLAAQDATRSARSGSMTRSWRG